MQCAVCIVQCAAFSVQRAVCSVQCAVFSVLCAVCSVWDVLWILPGGGLWKCSVHSSSEGGGGGGQLKAYRVQCIVYILEYVVYRVQGTVYIGIWGLQSTGHSV